MGIAWSRAAKGAEARLERARATNSRFEAGLLSRGVRTVCSEVPRCWSVLGANFVDAARATRSGVVRAGSPAERLRVERHERGRVVLRRELPRSPVNMRDLTSLRPSPASLSARAVQGFAVSGRRTGWRWRCGRSQASGARQFDEAALEPPCVLSGKRVGRRGGASPAGALGSGLLVLPDVATRCEGRRGARGGAVRGAARCEGRRGARGGAVRGG